MVFWAKSDPIWAKWDPSGQIVRKVGKSALELGKKNTIMITMTWGAEDANSCWSSSSCCCKSCLWAYFWVLSDTSSVTAIRKNSKNYRYMHRWVHGTDGWTEACTDISIYQYIRPLSRAFGIISLLSQTALYNVRYCRSWVILSAWLFRFNFRMWYLSFINCSLVLQFNQNGSSASHMHIRISADPCPSSINVENKYCWCRK